MKRLSSTIIFALLLLCAVARAVPQVTVITIGPGDVSFEKFGHVILRVNDADRHFDAAYSWGVFDFDAPNFVGNFILGRMTYRMDAYEPHSTMIEYYRQDRRVRQQVLRLSPAEADTLLMLCETNRLPENRYYRYDYFTDNCSTRVRDMIDQATGGRLSRECLPSAKPAGLSFRQETLRLMQDDFWLSFGIDFCLGPSCDQPLSAWDECFLPMRLADVVAPIVEEPPAPWVSKRPPEPASVPHRVPYAATVGVALAGLVIASHRWRRGAGRLLTHGWLLPSGFAGCFLIFVWTTDHAAAHANQNLLHFSPLAVLAFAFSIERGRRYVAAISVVVITLTIAAYFCRATGVLPDIAGAITAISVAIDLAAVPTLLVMLLPLPHRREAAVGIAAVVVLFSAAALALKLAGALGQANGTFIALALPLNLAALYVLHRERLTPAPPAIEVAVA